MTKKHIKVLINGKNFDLDMETALSTGVLAPSIELVPGDVYEYTKRTGTTGPAARVTLIKKVNGSWLLTGYCRNAFCLLDTSAQNDEDMIEWLRSNHYVRVGQSRLTVEA